MTNKTVRKMVANANGALKRYKLLQKALSHPIAIKAELCMACESQGKLARLKQPDSEIFPMSLNTLKSLADKEISNGGWAELDRVRRELYHWYRSSRKVQQARPRNTRDQLKTKLADLEEKVDQLHRGRAVLIKAYTEVLGIAQQAAKIDQQTQFRLDRHRAVFGDAGFHAVRREKSDA